MHLDDVAHRLAVGKLDIVEEAAAQESVGQFLLVVRGDDHDRTFLRLDPLARLVNVETHPVEFLQQIVGKLDIGLVNFVDQQDGQARGGEGLRSEEHTSEIQSLMRSSYAGFCLKKKKA